jgi:hypothetical protein
LFVKLRQLTEGLGVGSQECGERGPPLGRKLIELAANALHQAGFLGVHGVAELF